MKRIDVKSDINFETYDDEFKLIFINDDNSTINIHLNSSELLDLYYEIKHAVETTIC